MAKTGISLKVEEHHLKEIKKMAADHGKTVTEILVEGVFESRATFKLEEQIKDLSKQVLALTERLTRETEGRIKTKKRISIPVTDEEFEKIDKLAHESQISKAKLMRRVLVGKGLPALTS